MSTHSAAGLTVSVLSTASGSWEYGNMETRFHAGEPQEVGAPQAINFSEWCSASNHFFSTKVHDAVFHACVRSTISINVWTTNVTLNLTILIGTRHLKLHDMSAPPPPPLPHRCLVTVTCPSGPNGQTPPALTGSKVCRGIRPWAAVDDRQNARRRSSR